MLNSYHDYYYKYFAAKGWTSTHILWLVTIYIVIALPFYFSFAGTSFWTDTHTTLMNVNYNCTGYYALQVNYLNGATYGTDQYSNIPGNGMSAVPPARSASLALEDKSNTTKATLTLSGYSFEVLSANLILYFDVEVPIMQKIVSQAVLVNLAGNVETGTISGILKLQGNQPIEGMRYISNSNFPLYYPYQASGFTFSALTSYASQNYGLLKTVTQSSLIYSSAASRSTVLTLNKIKSTMINYSPTLLQTLKFKYSTFLAFAIIAYFVFFTLFKLYVEEGMLECHTYQETIHR